ncbi:MAG TPA: hypothetical protein VFH64_04135 [Amnibacterium sp.]|nr:hypothetical protein [Amnibacterium sp.]
MTQSPTPAETRIRPLGCPSWCTSDHGMQAGEEDWIHLGAPLHIADGVTARLCMSCDPVTGEQDGPLVLIGDREYSADEADALGISLTELAEAGRTTRCGAAG